MKNVLIYTGGRFNAEHERLARVQIDNSLDLGWKVSDILLCTDFPFSYNGVESILLPKGLTYDFDPAANKSKVIVHLLKDKILTKDVYWAHDFDAYENHKIDLKLESDLGLTHYHYKPQWQFGSVFFKDASLDVMELLDQTINERRYGSRNNEKNLTWLIKHQKIEESRYTKLNPTYNIMKRYLKQVLALAEQPLRVLHFLPSDKDALMKQTGYELFQPLMSDRLVKIFNYHTIV